MPYKGLDTLTPVQPGETFLCNATPEFLEGFSQAEEIDQEIEAMKPELKELEERLMRFKNRLERLKRKRTAIMVLAWEGLRAHSERLDGHMIGVDNAEAAIRSDGGIPVICAIPVKDNQNQGMPPFMMGLGGIGNLGEMLRRMHEQQNGDNDE